MDFFEVVERRHSIRAYLHKDLDQSYVDKILEAANKAPSAGNLQAYEIFLVKDPVKKRRLAEAALYQMFIADAPIVLVFCANPRRSSWRYGKRGEELYSIQDATIAAAFSMLACTALGLSSVWVGAFDERLVSAALGNPPNLRPIIILPIGYPGEEPEPTSRRSLKDLVHRL